MRDVIYIPFNDKTKKIRERLRDDFIKKGWQYDARLVLNTEEDEMIIFVLSK